TLMLTNEVCAYIAGALFNQFRKDEGLPSFDGTTQPPGGIYREAHAVAATMSRIMKKWNYTSCYNLMGSDREVAALVAAVKASSTRYDRDASYGEDGLSL